MGDEGIWGFCSGQGPAGLWGPNISLPFPEVKGLSQLAQSPGWWSTRQLSLYLWWLTQGLMGHLDATASILHSHTASRNKMCPSYVLLPFNTMQRKEEMVLTGHAQLPGHFSMDNQHFWYICHLLLWPGVKMCHLQSVPTALGLKWTIPKSAWPLPLAKAFEPVCKTDITEERLHMEQIGYTNIGSFA